MSQSGGGHTAAKSSSALTEGAKLVARVSASQLHSGQFIIWTVVLVAWEVQELEELAQGLRFWEMGDRQFLTFLMFPTN